MTALGLCQLQRFLPPVFVLDEGGLDRDAFEDAVLVGVPLIIILVSIIVCVRIKTKVLENILVNIFFLEALEVIARYRSYVGDIDLIFTEVHAHLAANVFNHLVVVSFLPTTRVLPLDTRLHHEGLSFDRCRLHALELKFDSIKFCFRIRLLVQTFP